MKKIIIYFIGIIILCGGCMNNDTDKTAITGAQYFELNSSEINKNCHLANNGNKNAAFILYQHYALGVYDKKASRYWLKKAVALGHEQAKQHLKVATDIEKTATDEEDSESYVESPFN